MKTIAIRLDAGKSIGVGHLMRCMALAESLQGEAEVSVIFICRDNIPLQMEFEVVYLDKDYSANKGGYLVLPIDDEVEELRNIIDDYHVDCLIVDHYGAGDDYFEKVREFVPWLICIDDSIKRSVAADMIINGNIYATDADYGTIPVQLLGGAYTLLRREFSNLSKRVLKKEIEDVYVTSGGSDPLQFCKCISETIINFAAGIKMHVIAGSDFEESYITELQKHNLFVHRKANMLACMQDADLFISSAGSTLYELAATGTPSISYILVDNQVRVAKRMWKEKCSMSGGYFHEFSPGKLLSLYHQITDYTVRKKMCEKAQKTVYGNGAANVARKIIALINGTKER